MTESGVSVKGSVTECEVCCRGTGEGSLQISGLVPSELVLSIQMSSRTLNRRAR